MSGAKPWIKPDDPRLLAKEADKSWTLTQDRQAIPFPEA
jgi:hypothetical protein